MSRRRGYDLGPACRTCGYALINVVHDDETERARAIETWAFATPGQNGQDYYTWAGVQYHPFVPVAPADRPLRTDYERGYQAGYHAALRRA